MKILYLYAELMGYQIPVLKEYVNEYDAEVHVVHWDHKKLTPYAPPTIAGINYYNRSDYNYKKLKNLVLEINPDIVYVSGWMDKDYLSICKLLKRSGIPIVAGCDTQWKGTIKQVLGSVYFRLFLKKKFNFIWVAGPYQYEYARMLGFRKNEIIFNCLTADVDLFNNDSINNSGKTKCSRKFLFLGRFEKVKGIDLLLSAWSDIADKKGWTLTFIGSGSYNEKLENREDLKVKNFMQPEDLAVEVRKYSYLILPSITEPWALVIQEMMAAGLPVLASDTCGAAPVFIIPNYNGKIFKTNSLESLINSINEIINLNDKNLQIMSKNAQERSNLITPTIVAASFISVLKH